MSDTWGKGSVNNNIGWGQAAGSATNDWGKSQKESWAGQTDIVGVASVSITYSSSAFCSDASDPTPTISNNAGAGTFSSTAGLVFISTTTGEVDLDASTAGATYVITYTDTDAATATFSLTINDLDNAAFAYSASSYEPTDADPAPTITGLTGGTFSGTTGLVINSTTGEIDLSASTVASHTITYDTTSSGSSVCPNTSTQNVDIALAGIANNYSMNFDGTNDNIDAGNISALNGATQATWSCWYKKTASGAMNFIGTWGGSTERLFLPYQFSQGASAAMYVYMGSSTGSNRLMFQNATNCVINLDTWYHMAFVYNESESSNSDKLKFYLDGTELPNETTGFALTSLNTVTASFNIGAPYSPYLTGNLDEIAIWNTALTSTQVSEIYNATSAGLTKDLSTIESSSLIYWNRLGD
tara:strand:+ start:1168 stop:2409 length:1242 start_codon:yes stop_codon:yes gene_type:complete